MGINKYRDAAAVQALLNKNRYVLVPFQPLDVDGDCGPKPIKMMLEYQTSVVGLNDPDGLVDRRVAVRRRL